MARKLAPAMAAGCTSVVKPASATPLTAAMVLRAIEEAGSPAGVANLITSSDAGLVAETLFGDRRVRKVSFTGSTEVGKELIRLSAGQVKRLSLELGGHAPFIVFDDADVEAAVEGLMTAKFRNAGQACVAANRVYVQEGIHDRFTATLAERVARLSIGPGDREGVDVGPLIDDRAVDKADEHVRDAIGAGAELIAGGRRPDGDQYELGSFYEPTLLLKANAGMLISREETFGPVCAITRFTDEEEVIRLANDSVYGLAAYLYTRENARLTRVSEQLDYGIVGVNTGLIAAPNTPFGGVKESGFGREGGSVGIDEYVDVKYVLIGGVGA
jgi:succinate-semialdehyde dehydrogenase/glutarate-semialdehyde dehydrogenase